MLSVFEEACFHTDYKLDHYNDRHQTTSSPPLSPPLSPYLSTTEDVQELDLDPSTELVEFRIGQRNVIATSVERLDEIRNVYRLKIKTPSIVDYIPIQLVRRLCDHILNLCPSIKKRFPEWFLPPVVVLKQRKTDWDNEFVNEIFIYNHLQPLQGIFIPFFYGQAEFKGVPTLVLSEVVGQTIFDSTDSYEGLKEKLEEAYAALDSHRVVHDDLTLLNAIDTGDRVILIDFEQSWVASDLTATLNGPDVGGLSYQLWAHKQRQAGKRINYASFIRKD